MRSNWGDNDPGELDGVYLCEESYHHMTLGHSCHMEMRSQGYQALTFSRQAGHLDFNIVSLNLKIIATNSHF